MKRIMVTGASGLLGSNLIMTLKGDFHLLAAYLGTPVSFGGAESMHFDILSEPDVERAVSSFSPQAIIHCAAETRVDFCEDHPDWAFRLNEEGTRIVASAAARHGAKIVYICTDSVFNGERGGYNEDDATHPLNVYALSKLAGEKAAAGACGDHLILRTNIFGWNSLPKVTLAEWVHQGLSEGKRIPGFTDVVFSPLLVNDLAGIIGEMVVADLRGLYHVGARDRCSKFEFARAIARAFGIDEGAVYESTSDEVDFKARRPKDTSMDVSKVTQALGHAMPGIVEGVGRFKRLLDEGFVDKLRS